MFKKKENEKFYKSIIHRFVKLRNKQSLEDNQYIDKKFIKVNAK
jgi:hypothetical protein